MCAVTFTGSTFLYAVTSSLDLPRSHNHFANQEKEKPLACFASNSLAFRPRPGNSRLDRTRCLHDRVARTLTTAPGVRAPAPTPPPEGGVAWLSAGARPQNPSPDCRHRAEDAALPGPRPRSFATLLQPTAAVQPCQAIRTDPQEFPTKTNIELPINKGKQSISKHLTN